MPSDRRGVAGAVATMFVLLIVLAFINLYVIGYVPAAVKSQEYNHMSTVHSEFSSFRLSSYDLESTSWPLPEAFTFDMGTPGYAPFASPTSGQLTFSSSGGMTVSFQLGVPLYLPSPASTSYYGTGVSRTGTIQYSSAYSGKVMGLVFNGSGKSYNVDIGSSTHPISGFTLLMEVNGANNHFNIFGNGSSMSIWYISNGNSNVLGQFSLKGTSNSGYVQDYGAGDLAPAGWPHFQSISENLAVSGVLSLFVHNQYYTPQEYAFQGGAIIANQSSGSIMLSTPQFSASNQSTGADLSMNLISLLGQGFTASGSGPSVITSSFYGNQSYNVGSYDGLNIVSSVTLKVSTSFVSAWETFFASQLSSLENVTSNPGIAQTLNGGTGASYHVPWGAYSLSSGASSVTVTVYNINALDLLVGFNQLQS